MTFNVVLDTNVIVSALLSRNGASFQILSRAGTGAFDINLSVPLLIEYEDATKRRSREMGLRHSDIDDVLDYLCKVAKHREIFFLWRPFLRDAEDDMLLELAVESNCDCIVTHNVKDFVGVNQFGLKVMKPKQFLGLIERAK